MMEHQPNADEIIDIEGPAGETLFWHLKGWLVRDREDAIQQRLDELWEHYKEVQDERLLALVGAMCIEASLDNLLSKFAPQYDVLLDNVDVTFSVKIGIAKALRLIPSKILNSCDLARGIRNDFAHNLDVSQFRELERKRLDKLGPYVRLFNTGERDWEDWPALYRDMIGFTAAGLTAYALQIETLRDYLGTDEFRRYFKDHTEQSSS